MRAAIYARVSTRDKQQDVENQLLQLREFAGHQGWTVSREYIDQASGKNSKRDEFREMFSAASKRAFDVVLVWALDRLTREGVAETFEHIKRLKSHGVDFISYTEEHFRTTGSSGELLIAVAAWIAKQERIRMSERSRAGLERVRRTGTKSGKPIGRPRVIFRRDQVNDLRAQGLSWSEIAKAMGTSQTSVRRACDLAKTVSTPSPIKTRETNRIPNFLEACHKEPFLAKEVS